MKASETVVTPFARLALGFSFLSAVADPFGLWGALGAPHVAWGDFAFFITYTATLNWFLPRPMIPALAWLATGAEVTLGIALILGVFTRTTAFLSRFLLLLFALAMAIALGLKGPLDASVFSSSAAAFLLATAERYPFSVDSIFRERTELISRKTGMTGSRASSYFESDRDESSKSSTIRSTECDHP